jgi:hypothetical protein
VEGVAELLRAAGSGDAPIRRRDVVTEVTKT